MYKKNFISLSPKKKPSKRKSPSKDKENLIIIKAKDF